MYIWATDGALEYVKHLKLNKRSHLSGSKIKNQAMIYTKVILNKARVKRNELNKSDLVWSEEDMHISLGLENFGVDLEGFQPATVLEKIFRCWIEDW